MSAIDTLRAARALGIELAVDGNDLLLEAAAEPSGATIEALAKHKVEIIKLLRPSKDGWSADDWQLYFEERAAVAEFDGGLPRSRRRGSGLRMLRRRMVESESDAVCSGSLLVVRPTRKPWRCRRALRDAARDPRLATR